MRKTPIAPTEDARARLIASLRDLPREQAQPQVRCGSRLRCCGAGSRTCGRSTACASAVQAFKPHACQGAPTNSIAAPVDNSPEPVSTHQTWARALK